MKLYERFTPIQNFEDSKLEFTTLAATNIHQYPAVKIIDKIIEESVELTSAIEHSLAYEDYTLKSYYSIILEAYDVDFAAKMAYYYLQQDLFPDRQKQQFFEDILPIVELQQFFYKDILVNFFHNVNLELAIHQKAILGNIKNTIRFNYRDSITNYSPEEWHLVKTWYNHMCSEYGNEHIFLINEGIKLGWVKPVPNVTSN